MVVMAFGIFPCLFPAHRPLLSLQKKEIMATLDLQTSFEEIYISSMLPEDITFSCSGNVVSVELYLIPSFEKVFTADFYTYNGVAAFKDIRSIIETLMIERDMNFVTLRIVYVGDGILKYIDGIKVVFGGFKYPDGSEAFLEERFMTTIRCALVPRGRNVLLHYYSYEQQVVSCFADVYYSVPGETEGVRTFLFSIDRTRAEEEGIMRWEVDFGLLQSNMLDETGVEDTVIHAVRLGLDDREFWVYYTEEEPTEVLTFRNGYNVDEIAYIYGKKTTKTTVTKSEAVCGKLGQFYDVKATLKREIETAPIQQGEAIWLNQLFTSHHVTRKVASGESAEVLISDVTSEVSDSNKELTRLKFSWRYADGEERED